MSTSYCEVSLIDNPDTDLTVVNAARVSLAKHHSKFDEVSDARLIQFLASNNHWTPFAHSSLYYYISWPSAISELHFLRNISSGGRDFIASRGEMRIRGSLYFWIQNAQYLPEVDKAIVYNDIINMYPYTASAFNLSYTPEDEGNKSVYLYSLEDIYSSPKWDGLIAYTLRIKCPLFIARQVRTSHVGISYSDSDSLYEEGENFVYNEVSRRYVDSEPEFYKFLKFRVREGKNVKQGFTGYAGDRVEDIMQAIQYTVEDTALDFYGQAKQYNIAPEQSRAFLPQSMFTEFYMTATVRRWYDWWRLRLKSDVQQETRELAMQVEYELMRG